MENKKLQVWLPLLFSIIMVAGMMIGYKLREESGIKKFFTLNTKTSYQQVLDLINLKYVDKVGTDTLSNNAINNLLHHLDPHSVYIPAGDLGYINDDLRGNFSGIGIEFQMFYDTVNVLNVLPGGPSEQRLQVGDKFLKVNDSITIAGKHLEPNDIRRLLRGASGSPVKLTVLREHHIIPVSVSRGTIPVPSVDASYMITPSTGFIHINKFAESTYREFMMSLEKLKAQHLQKLILDLRGNGGGLLSVAVNIADEFLDGNKLIVYTKGSHVQQYEYKCKRDGLFETGELVLLVDEGSASASEVLGGALQDWDRATIVGRRTFGKGLVQEQFELDDGSALRLTVARYYSPLGRNIQKPYTEGYDKYEEEVLNRFHDGEVIKGDTAKRSGPSFKTPKGRIVYGGGGITPDIYVSFDTARISPQIMNLYLKGTLSNFIYSYFINNKQHFNDFKKAADITAFKAGETEWSALKQFAARDSIILDKVSVKDKAAILKRMPALMARQIWRYEGYYEVVNQSDDFVKKALQVLKESEPGK